MQDALIILSLIGFFVGGAWSRAQALGHDRGRFFSLLQVDLFIGFFVALALIKPGLFDHWTREDGWAEWATFCAFTAAGLLFFRRARRSQHQPPIGRLLIYLTALFCILVAGEEISWGQRLLAFKPPDLFLEHNFQQELNVHNFINNKEFFGKELGTRHFVALVAIAYAILLPLLCAFLNRVAGLLDGACPSMNLAPWFLLIAAVELDYPISGTGEAAELILGMLFLADAVLRSRDLGMPGLFAPTLSVLAGIILVPAIDLLVYGSDEEATQQAQTELETLRDDLKAPGALEQSMLRKSSIHKRIFTALTANYLDFDASRNFLEGGRSPGEDAAVGVEIQAGRLGYFLDPWHNPYWIAYQRKSKVVILYSFGPNRRRDSKIEKFKGAKGDDIVVTFSALDVRRR